jgi:hypothetical protein
MGLFNSFPIDDIDLQNVIDTLIYIETKVDFGIIAMEYANNTKILYDLSPNVRPNSNYELYVNMSLYLLLELALKTGYSHADFHMSNIMINRSAVDYFDGIPGKPIIIDFGFSVKIPDPVLEEMRVLCYEHNYTEALRILCTVDRSDEDRIHNYPKYYGWVCGTVAPFSTMNEIEREIESEVNYQITQLISDRKFVQTYGHLDEPHKKALLERYRAWYRMQIIKQISLRQLYLTSTNDKIQDLFERRTGAINRIVVETLEKLNISLPLDPEIKRKLIDEYHTTMAP